MTIIKKAALFCDGCGKRQDLEWKDADTLLSPISTRGTYLEGWHAVDREKHLCPECYPAYAEREERMRRELREMVGGRSIEFDI